MASNFKEPETLEEPEAIEFQETAK